jgi:hypothetical protein
VDEDDDAAEAECETSSDGHVQGGHVDHDDGGPAWDLETQPPDISEEEAIAITMANSELDQLAMRDGLDVQLHESWLAQGTPATPPATPTHSNGRAPAPAPSTSWDP